MSQVIRYLTPTAGEEDPQFQGKIRVTDDGRISIIDVLSCFGFKTPRDIWFKLQKSHPEVVGDVTCHQFTGQGQKETPVACFNDIKTILCALPALHYDFVTAVKAAPTLEELVSLVKNLHGKKRKQYRTEKDVQAELAEKLKGEREVRCSSGIIDILVRDAQLLVEVKEMSAWVHAVGQLLVYGADFPGYKLRLHLFMTPKSPPMHPERLFTIREKCGLFGIELTLDESIELRPKSKLAVH